MLTRKRGRPQTIEPRFPLKMLEFYFWPERWALPAYLKTEGPLMLRTAPTYAFQVTFVPVACALAWGRRADYPSLRALTIGRRNEVRATLAVLAEVPVWGTIDRWSLLYLLYDRCRLTGFALPRLYRSRGEAYAEQERKVS